MPKVETFNKETVLSQAIHVFHNKGYNATSMQDLVDATGLNRSSIYNSFGSKQDLFLECLKMYQNEAKTALSNIIVKCDCSLRAIENIFSLYYNDISNDKDRKGCLISNCTAELANQEPLIKTFLNTNQDNMLALLEDLITKAQTNKSINTKKTAREYALYLFTTLQGYRLTGILLNDKTQLRSIVDTTLQNLK